MGFFSYRRKNKEDTVLLLGARCVIITDDREKRATGYGSTPASQEERKLFILEGELQEVVSTNGSRGSKALSIPGGCESLCPSKVCHLRSQKELVADKLAVLFS